MKFSSWLLLTLIVSLYISVGRVHAAGSAAVGNQAPVNEPKLETLQRKVLYSGVSADEFAYLQGLVEKRPNDARARYVLGLAYDKAGFQSLATEQYEQVKALDPRLTREIVAKFRKMVADGNTALAMVNSAGIRVLSPEEPAMYFLDGLRLYQQRRYAAAAVFFEKAMQLDKGLPGVASARALIELQTGDYKKAFDFAQADWLKQPDSYSANLVKGQTLLALKRYKEAVRPFAVAFQKHPDWPDTGFYYGQALLLDGHPDKAIEPALVDLSCQYEKAKLDRTKMLLVEVLTRVSPKQASAAISEAAHQIKHSYDPSRMYFALADVYDHIGQGVDAIKVRAVGLRLNPRYAHGCYRMGESCEQLGDYYWAQKWYAKAVQIEPLKSEYKNAWTRAMERLVAYQNDLAAQLRDWLRHPGQNSVDIDKYVHVAAPG